MELPPPQKGNMHYLAYGFICAIALFMSGLDLFYGGNALIDLPVLFLSGFGILLNEHRRRKNLPPPQLR